MTRAAAASLLPVRLAASVVVLSALAVPAFWPAYLGKPLSVDPYTHVHALFGLLWLALLLAQPLLVRARKIALHRAVGRAGVAVGIGFVVTSVLLTHHRASRMDAELFAREGFGFYLPLVMAALFAAAFALALIWRRVTPLHGRYMAATALTLVDPVLARLLFFYAPPLPAPLLYQMPAFTIIVVVLLALLRSIPPGFAGRRAFRAFTIATVAALLLFFLTPHSVTWLRFLQWFRSLPLT